MDEKEELNDDDFLYGDLKVTKKGSWYHIEDGEVVHKVQGEDALWEKLGELSADVEDEPDTEEESEPEVAADDDVADVDADVDAADAADVDADDEPVDADAEPVDVKTTGDDSEVVIKMTLDKVKYEYSGYVWTRKHPFQVVSGRDNIEHLLNKEGFERAVPSQVEAYYS